MLLALVACTSPDPDAAPAFDAVLPALSVRGVLVLHVDTLRADHLTAYGYARNTTPNLARLPWRVVHGERATTSWTMPSTASFLTSLEPERHGLLYWGVGGPNGPLLAPTWAGQLSEAGWATGQFTGNTFASAQAHLEVGFDVSVLETKQSTGQANLELLGTDLLDWLDTLPDDQPWMAHLQPMETHNPYSPTASDLARFRADPVPFARSEVYGYTEPGFTDAWNAAAEEDRPAIDQAVTDIYDASLYGLDREIGDLLAALDDRALLDDTLVVLTADHGQTLDDPGGGVFGHQIGWREELVQLPLMFLHPDVPAGHVTCLSQNTDVWPTIAGALGVEGPPDLDGVDLAQGCRSLARGSLWTNAGTLDTLGAADTSGALKRDCRGDGTAGTSVGAGADPTETTPVEDVPHGAELDEAIAAYETHIVGLIPEADCPE